MLARIWPSVWSWMGIWVMSIYLSTLKLHPIFVQVCIPAMLCCDKELWKKSRRKTMHFLKESLKEFQRSWRRHSCQKFLKKIPAIFFWVGIPGRSSNIIDYLCTREFKKKKENSQSFLFYRYEVVVLYLGV